MNIGDFISFNEANGKNIILVMPYYNDALLCYDISPEELKQVYTEKFEKNMKRW